MMLTIRALTNLAEPALISNDVWNKLMMKSKNIDSLDHREAEIHLVNGSLQCSTINVVNCISQFQQQINTNLVSVQ